MLRRCFLLGVALFLSFALSGASTEVWGASRESALQVQSETVELPPLPEIIIAALEEKEPGRPGPGGRRDMSPEEAARWRERREQREENIHMLQLWKIMQDTELREDQGEKFFPFIREYQEKERDLADRRRTIVRSLRAELRKENPDKGQLNKLSKEMIQVSSDLAKVKHEGMTRIMEILDPRQKAKFVLSVSEVERDMLEAISRARTFGNGPGDLGREQMRERMEQVRTQVEKIKKELKEKGYPVESGKK